MDNEFKILSRKVLFKMYSSLKVFSSINRSYHLKLNETRGKVYREIKEYSLILITIQIKTQTSEKIIVTLTDIGSC